MIKIPLIIIDSTEIDDTISGQKLKKVFFFFQNNKIKIVFFLFQVESCSVPRRQNLFGHGEFLILQCTL